MASNSANVLNSFTTSPSWSTSIHPLCVSPGHKRSEGNRQNQSCPLQRCFRDVHVVTQHASVASGSLELAGRALLGVEADYSIL
jgi:hypothetical protein